MRLTILAGALLLLTPVALINHRDPLSFQREANKISPDLQRLEALFKEIDKESGPVEAEVYGDKESEGRVKISVESSVSTTANAASGVSGGAPKSKKETAFYIDLREIDVPEAYINEKIAAAFLAPKENETLPGVKVMQVGATGIYEVVEDYTYDSGTYRITALKGFQYDRASIPRIFWVLIDKDSLSNVPPLFHDLLYRHGGELPTNQLSPLRKFSRKDTDDLFLELMTKCGVRGWRRELAYQAVRNFSGFAWKGR